MLQLDVSRLISTFWTVHAEQSNSVFCHTLSISDHHWILTATELPCWMSCKRTWQSSGINFSLCPLLLVNQKITFRKPHNFDKWTMSIHPCWAQMGQWDGTGSSLHGLRGSWAWHRKQHVWIMNELNMPNVQFIKIISHDSVWFFSVRFHLEGGKWHLCDLPSKVLGQETFIKMKNCSLSC